MDFTPDPNKSTRENLIDLINAWEWVTPYIVADTLEVTRSRASILLHKLVDLGLAEHRPDGKAGAFVKPGFTGEIPNTNRNTMDGAIFHARNGILDTIDWLGYYDPNPKNHNCWLDSRPSRNVIGKALTALQVADQIEKHPGDIYTFKGEQPPTPEQIKKDRFS